MASVVGVDAERAQALQVCFDLPSLRHCGKDQAPVTVAHDVMLDERVFELERDAVLELEAVHLFDFFALFDR